MSGNRPRFSVVIPAYNEECELPGTLAAFAGAMDQYRLRGGIGEFEFIVVDNNSTDGTREIAEQFGAIVVSEPLRQIARVRNTGMQAATGEIIVTCDADSQPHRKIFVEIERCMNANVFAGGVRIWAKKIKWTWYPSFWFVNGISWIRRLPCGMFFLRRSDLEAIGGFDESLFALEDVAFSRKLRAEARKRKMRISILLDRPILTSTRKFRYGKMGTMFLMGGLGMLHPKKYLTRRDYWDSTYYGENLRDAAGGPT